MTLPLRLLAASALACLPFALDAQEAPVDREVVGTRTSENIPPIPAELLDRLNRYQNTRSANVADWTADGCLLVSTRFAETSQVHRVCEPMGMREQLTFYPEPVAGVVAAPSGHNGFVFAKDTGGDEFSQLSWFDLGTREATLLTDGKRSQNRGALFSHDGRLLAYSSTARNGSDTDIVVRDMATGEQPPVAGEQGAAILRALAVGEQRGLAGIEVEPRQLRELVAAGVLGEDEAIAAGRHGGDAAHGLGIERELFAHAHRFADAMHLAGFGEAGADQQAPVSGPAGDTGTAGVLVAVQPFQQVRGYRRDVLAGAVADDLAGGVGLGLGQCIGHAQAGEGEGGKAQVHVGPLVASGGRD